MAVEYATSSALTAHCFLRQGSENKRKKRLTLKRAAVEYAPRLRQQVAPKGAVDQARSLTN
jgi:hypothetical protein